MNNQQLACEPERIELFLHHHMNAEEQAECETHLDGCDGCRFQLEQAVASQDVWTTIRESLNSESPSLECENPSAKAIDLAACGDSPAFGVETALQLLAPTDDDRMLGRLGTYEVVGIIGTGGMGVVFKAFDPALNRYVAIKILSPHLGNSGAARKRFSREAQAAAAVVHDNVVEIHGVADTNGLPHLVMAYLKGPSLQKRLDEDGPLSVVEILRIAKQAAAGLAEAHTQGLVHRDVKPANILLADGVERVKLTDFGLARAADDASLTKTGVIAGTPQFMSPEQARGDAVRRYMIVLTNGDPSLDDDAILREFCNAGITISVVHLESHGPRYEAVPKRIAKTTGGKYYHVLNAKPSVVEGIFRRETRQLVESKGL